MNVYLVLVLAIGYLGGINEDEGGNGEIEIVSYSIVAPKQIRIVKTIMVMTDFTYLNMPNALAHGHALC